MSIDILAVSGSPVKDSNTDRLIQKIVRASGLNSEFTKHYNLDKWLYLDGTPLSLSFPSEHVFSSLFRESTLLH